MTNKAAYNQQRIQEISHQYHAGELTREQAQEAAAPIIEDINQAAKRIAKKYGMRPKLISFIEIMR